MHPCFDWRKASAVGALGYTFAVNELVEQNAGENWIVFATSSGGTHAGLVLGRRLFEYQGKLLGISIDESEEWLRTNVAEFVNDDVDPAKFL